MTSLAELLRQFQADLVSQGQRLSTAIAYTRDVKRFMAWYEAKYGTVCDLRDITPEIGRAYQVDLQQTLQPGTVNRSLVGLRVFLTWAVAAGHLPENPLAQVAGVPVHIRKPIWLTRDEQRRLVAALNEAVNRARYKSDKELAQAVLERAIVLTMLHTGMSTGEVVRLTLADVVLDNDNGKVFVPGESPRVLALNAEVRQALAAYLAFRPNLGKRFFVRVGKRQVQRILQKYAEAIHVPRELMTAYVLRDTFGYNLLQAGVPLHQVAALLGYESLNPLRGYLIQPPANLQQAVETFVIDSEKTP